MGKGVEGLRLKKLRNSESGVDVVEGMAVWCGGRVGVVVVDDGNVDSERIVLTGYPELLTCFPAEKSFWSVYSITSIPSVSTCSLPCLECARRGEK